MVGDGWIQFKHDFNIAAVINFLSETIAIFKQ